MRKPFNLLLPAALLLLLLLLRCQWPAASGETAHIHGAIADSILNGNKWGLVALVQYPDAPLVPTLALALAKCLAAPLGLSPYALLAAVAQTLAAAILIRRLPLRRLPGLLALLSLLALPLIPLTRQAILLNDPNWLAAVPLLLALAQLDEFSHRPQLKPLIGIAANALRITGCMFPIVGYQMVTTNFFQCIGKVKVSIFLSLSRQLIFLLPMLWLLPHLFQLNGVWFSMPASDLLASLVTPWIMARYMRKFMRQQQEKEIA